MNQNKTVAFHTLGCKLNFAETSTIGRLLENVGFTKVGFEESADIYVINTCSVTENADKECRSIIRKALKYSPNAQIVITGCYAQLKPAEIASFPGVDLVLGAREKFEIVEHLRKLPEKKQVRGTYYACDLHDSMPFNSSFSFGERSRAFLKVQDGCDYSCTYCTIPQARGRSRSDTISNVVQQAGLLALKGVKEIVLTGVNIGDFGITNSQEGIRSETFFDLIKALDSVDGIERFRISSIEPNLLHDQIINFVARSRRFMPHFHIPLQSGSDAILKLMKRRYLTDLYSDRVNKIKSVMPHCCIGVDVITGFPGETENDFLTTYRFLNQLDISYLHVFTYSERDNTEASSMSNAVPKAIRNERTKMLRSLSEKKKRAFYESHLNETRSTMFELHSLNGMLEGITDNYIKIKVPANKLFDGSIGRVYLKEISGDAILAMPEIKNMFQNQPDVISVYQ